MWKGDYNREEINNSIMTLTIDPKSRKVYLNDIEVNDPIIIGETILRDLKKRPIKKEMIIKKYLKYCKDNKLTPTQERGMILEIILNTENYFSITEICKKIPFGNSISRGTVFHALNLFEAAGIISEFRYIKRTAISKAAKYYRINN